MAKKGFIEASFKQIWTPYTKYTNFKPPAGFILYIFVKMKDEGIKSLLTYMPRRAIKITVIHGLEVIVLKQMHSQYI